MQNPLGIYTMSVWNNMPHDATWLYLSINGGGRYYSRYSAPLSLHSPYLAIFITSHPRTTTLQLLCVTLYFVDWNRESWHPRGTVGINIDDATASTAASPWGLKGSSSSLQAPSSQPLHTKAQIDMLLDTIPAALWDWYLWSWLFADLGLMYEKMGWNTN